MMVVVVTGARGLDEFQEDPVPSPSRLRFGISIETRSALSLSHLLALAPRCLSTILSPGSLGRTAGSSLNVLSRPYSLLSHRLGLTHVRRLSQCPASHIPYVLCIPSNPDRTRRPRILGGRLLRLYSHTPAVITLPRSSPFYHLRRAALPFLSPPAGLSFVLRKSPQDL